mmetsp:Transcript_10554/g.27126  ORF Transcript_10554/g.27126 Transcript_10554/m.27126 type:complete len:356 (-) Transcript_10554:147-1214(-)
MGASGHMIMFHHQHWWHSGDGGHNFFCGNLPGTGGSFDYVRKAGSRSEPAGTAFAILNAPAPPATVRGRWVGDEPDCHAKDASVSDAWCQQNCPERCPAALCSCGDDDDDDVIPSGHNYRPDAADGKDPDDGDHELDIDDMNPYNKGPGYTAGVRVPADGTVNWLMTSEDFGLNWTWAPLPTDFQAGWLACNPTDPDSLFGLTRDCLRESTDKGKTWSDCSKGTGLTGSFSKLLIKDSKTMFMLRSGAVPLRTQDGGDTWHELDAAGPLFKYGATFDGSISWSGETLVLSGFDGSAVGRRARGTSVWRSADDGDSWTDETGDVITNSPGPGMWYDKDFYFVTRGEGVMVKRNFET